MKNLVLITLTSILLGTCNGVSSQEPIKNGLKISSDLLNKIQATIKKEALPFSREVWKYDKEGNEENYTIKNGVYFDFVDEITAHNVFLEFKDQVKSEGNYLFLTELDFDDSYSSFYDIVILKCSDQFELVKLIGTNGINYNRYNDDVLKQLKAWHEDLGFEVVVVDHSRIHAYMSKKPSDIGKFAQEVYDFCPDVIDQGYSSMEEMISDYKSNNYFWLWWD